MDAGAASMTFTCGRFFVYNRKAMNIRSPASARLRRSPEGSFLLDLFA